MSNTKKAKIIDCHEAPQTFVDELALIHELGAVTHLKFATTIVESYDNSIERRIVAHLIIPNDARLKMAKALLGQGDLRADATDFDRDEELTLH
jgi:hypothetical protein